MPHYTDVVGPDREVYAVLADAIYAVRHDIQTDEKLMAAFTCFSERRDVLMRVVHAIGGPTPTTNPLASPLERALLACDTGLCAVMQPDSFALQPVLLRRDRLRETEDVRGPTA